MKQKQTHSTNRLQMVLCFECSQECTHFYTDASPEYNPLDRIMYSRTCPDSPQVFCSRNCILSHFIRNQIPFVDQLNGLYYAICSKHSYEKFLYVSGRLVCKKCHENRLYRIESSFFLNRSVWPKKKRSDNFVEGYVFELFSICFSIVSKIIIKPDPFYTELETKGVIDMNLLYQHPYDPEQFISKNNLEGLEILCDCLTKHSNYEFRMFKPRKPPVKFAGKRN